MVRYLTRTCPRCTGHVGIYVREPGQNLPLQAVNGHCVRCGYRLAWIVIRGSSNSSKTRKRQRTRIERPTYATTMRLA